MLANVRECIVQSGFVGACQGEINKRRERTKKRKKEDILEKETSKKKREDQLDMEYCILCILTYGLLYTLYNYIYMSMYTTTRGGKRVINGNEEGKSANGITDQPGGLRRQQVVQATIHR